MKPNHAPDHDLLLAALKIRLAVSVALIGGLCVLRLRVVRRGKPHGTHAPDNDHARTPWPIDGGAPRAFVRRACRLRMPDMRRIADMLCIADNGARTRERRLKQRITFIARCRSVRRGLDRAIGNRCGLCFRTRLGNGFQGYRFCDRCLTGGRGLGCRSLIGRCRVGRRLTRADGCFCCRLDWSERRGRGRRVGRNVCGATAAPAQVQANRSPAWKGRAVVPGAPSPLPLFQARARHLPRRPLRGRCWPRRLFGLLTSSA